jgi:hypothetical protein
MRRMLINTIAMPGGGAQVRVNFIQLIVPPCILILVALCALAVAGLRVLALVTVGTLITIRGWLIE